MSPRVKRCCVPGCDDRIMRRFAIPQNKAVSSIWLERIGNENLLAVQQSNYNTLKNYKVCGNHFAEVCKNASGTLLPRSLPTLNLPRYHGSTDRENCFLQEEPEVVKYVTPEKVREALTSALASENVGHSGGKVITPAKTYQRREQSAKKRKLFPTDEPWEEAGCSTSVAAISAKKQRGECQLLGVSNLPLSPRVQERKKHPKTLCTVVPKRGLLRTVGASRQAALSPDAKVFYKVAKDMQKKAMERSIRLASIQKKIRYLERKPRYLEILKNVNDVTKTFFMSQMRHQKKKPRGRRFSLEDKILALSIYKQSGKCYKFLSQIFSLPSRKTLSTLLNKVPLNAGINEAVFEHIKTRVSKMGRLDKYCVLMFDEIALETGLQYNQKNDCIDGFVDMGNGVRRCAFADHALVFLIKGIASSWKMPIAFVFCEGTTPTPDLTRLLKSVIRAVNATGLSIVATICDQGATNRATVNGLFQDTNSHFLKKKLENKLVGYLIDDKEIIHLYDFPHLMKGIRNGLLEHNLHFFENATEKVASWSHVKKMYELDKRRGAFSQFKKITDEHIYDEKIKKMKVKNCTQVFSFTYASTMKLYAEYSQRLDSSDELYLTPEASDTADLLYFFDKLFDSVNGTLSFGQPGKELRGAVTEKSSHLPFWQSALPVLKSMFSPSAKIKQSPSIKNWYHNIQSVIYLRSKLLSLGFKRFAMRNFNQDPLENFFSCVRSQGVRNTNPTCSAFIFTYKSLLINNLVSRRSLGTNCEEDASTGVLYNLRDFLTEDSSARQFICPTVQAPVFPSTSSFSSSSTTSFIADYTNAYVSGYVAKKILDQGRCSVCMSNMCTTQELPENVLILKRQYEGCKLVHPSSKFSQIFNKCTKVILNHFTANITLYEIKIMLKKQIREEILTEIASLFCSDHNSNIELFITTTVNIVVHHYINSINKILKGKDLRNANRGDYVKSLAFSKCAKRYGRKKK